MYTSINSKFIEERNRPCVSDTKQSRIQSSVEKKTCTERSDWFWFPAPIIRPRFSEGVEPGPPMRFARHFIGTGADTRRRRKGLSSNGGFGRNVICMVPVGGKPRST